MSRTLGLALGAALATAAAAEPAPLGLRDLEEAAAREKAEPGAAASLAGRRFELDVAPREAGPTHSLCDGFPIWGYHPAEAAFSASVSEGSIATHDFRDASGKTVLPRPRAGEELHFISVACRYERLPTRTFLNYADEERILEPVRQEVVALAHLSREMSASNYWQVPADSAEGAALGRSIVLRIGGRLGEWEPGRPIVCGLAADMMRVAMEDELRACLIKGKVDRVQYVDRATGRVVAVRALRDKPWPGRIRERRNRRDEH